MISIINYQPSWPDEFRVIADDLRRVLATTAIRIDHIGSTAVPGLAAKDIIDIQVSVNALEKQIIESLSKLGYSKFLHISCDHQPPGDDSPAIEWEKWFFSPPPGQRATNLHLRVEGRSNQRYALLFRDYLRCHPATAAAYAQLKRKLASELRDKSRYPDVKDPAVDLIYLAAEEWAIKSDWAPGPSDC